MAANKSAEVCGDNFSISLEVNTATLSATLFVFAALLNTDKTTSSNCSDCFAKYNVKLFFIRSFEILFKAYEI